MQAPKSYGQFCALARALDHVGDRWTLLIVRELLLGPKRFGELLERLPGIATNLLAHRLARLEADGIAARSDHPQRSALVTYRLTPLGKALEPAVFEMIRWGAAWMGSGPGGDRVDGRWAALALRALLESPAFRRPAGALKLEIGGQQLWVLVGRQGRVVSSQPPKAEPQAVVSGPFPAVMAIAAGIGDSEAEKVQISGDKRFALAALRGPRLAS